MSTEAVDPRFAELDAWPLDGAMAAMWEGQLAAVAAVRSALPVITAATAAAAAALGTTGRLIYVGAGTSGRVAVQDGTELPPTFNWPRARLVFGIAGGERALVHSVEGAEDDSVAGAALIDEAGVGPADVVIGVAASGTTPYTVAATARATERGAVSIGIANNPACPLLAAASHPILVETGGELIAGSTRMKAGTAQKVVLNLISSGIMLQLGRVYRGMMVDMRTANVKLQRRAEEMVARIAGVTQDLARDALAQSAGEIKLASLLALGHDRAAAEAVLARSGGNLRTALGR
jgi:N-acetylmuramic acid 6-phosphate etherase